MLRIVIYWDWVYSYRATTDFNQYCVERWDMDEMIGHYAWLVVDIKLSSLSIFDMYFYSMA